MICRWKEQWMEWMKERTPLGRFLPPILAISYLAILSLLGNLRSDHWLLSFVCLVLWYGGPYGRKIFFFALPLFLTGIVYDSQRFYSDYIRSWIRVEEPYKFDLFFFGINTPLGRLTPNEWFQTHTLAILDFFCGLAYLIFIGVFVAEAAYWRFYSSRFGSWTKSAYFIRSESWKPMWAFFIVNIVGYSTYYWFPAAPPWYVALHGLGPARMDTLPNPAGCIRFDQLLGTHFFTGMYGRSADVFGAVPSLHVAYPLQAVYYSFRFGTLRVFSVLFFLLMSLSAVYLNHHYVLDLMWGWTYAIIVCVAMDRIWPAKIVV